MIESSATRSSTVWLTALLGISVAAVVALAFFQYRWVDQVSRAEGERMRANMAFAARRFADDVDRDITVLFAAFRDADAEPPALVGRYDQWSRVARNPRLARAIYVLDRAGDESRLLKLDIDREALEPVEWPAGLRDALTRSGRFRRSPLIPEVPALVIPARPSFQGMPPEQRGFPRQMPDEPRPPFPGPPGRFGGQPQPRRQIVIVEIDRAYLTRELFPSLAKQHFQVDARELDVAITDGEAIVFRSDAAWPESVTAKADVESRLLEIRGVPPMAGEGPNPPPPIAGEGAGAPPGAWRLIARRHAGPLDQLVASARRRYLAISFGMLVILAGTGVILAMLLRRAERLRLQQLEFVAGVTHELNTPLAALGSAGQNLADGIITADDQVRRYGQMIVRESSRLADMVSQVLEFAGMRSGRAPLGREPVSASAVVEQAVENCASFAAQGDIVIEKDLRADGVIDGERAALVRAVENLLSNALKHGAAGKKVRVHTSRSKDAVSITVEDSGRGVAARDVPRMFEPFYRGRGAEQTRGSGLGLPIVRRIVEAHGGSVSVDRRRERGASFTIRLPILPGAEASRAVPEEHA